MIRAVGEADGKPLVILGLEPQNMARLREGQPIRVNLRNLVPGGPPIDALPDVDVVILFGGQDEIAALRAATRRSGGTIHP